MSLSFEELCTDSITLSMVACWESFLQAANWLPKVFMALEPPEELRRAMHYLKSHRFPRLRFSESLESQFVRDELIHRSNHLSRAVLWIIVPNALFLLNDWQAVPQRFGEAALLRLAVFPILALTASWMLHASLPRFARSLIVIGLGGVAAVSSCYLYVGSHEILAINTVAGLLLSLLATNVVLRLRWRYSFFCACACVATSIAFLKMNAALSVSDRNQLITITAITALLMLFASYSLERDERLSYLLQRTNDLQTEELKQLNGRLELLSSHDGLTGLTNRATFETRFNEIWLQAGLQRSPVSAIMIDIDHFKKINDTQGHLYGDQVIKRVATLIQDSLRGTDDFAARYGGEEFVVLLPNDGRDAARKLAERICSVVRLAGSPATVRPSLRVKGGPWVTVSCGYATISSPSPGDSEVLLQMADDALYEAKAQGRDRACGANTMPKWKLERPI